MQSSLEVLLLGASTGVTEGPEETEQTKIASFLLVPQDLAGRAGDLRASGACRFRADSGQLAQPLEWGQPRVATSHPTTSSALLDRDKSSQQSRSFLHAQAFAQAHFSLFTLSLVL